MIKNVFIRTRPGIDPNITDGLLIAVGDCIREAGLYIITQKDEIDDSTLVLSLGGDGTMISSIYLASNRDSYVAGFNYGDLGYLVPCTASSTNDLIAQLTALITDVNFPDSTKSTFKVTKVHLPVLTWKKNQAINDFYFTPAANGTAADFKIAIGSVNAAFHTKSSGIVLSTPFGSTGLALSAGGPILTPDSNVLEIVPLLPHTLTSRPIIFPYTEKVVITWERKINMFADGHLIDTFGDGEVEIKCTQGKINLVQPVNWNFVENLKNKMRWHS